MTSLLVVATAYVTPKGEAPYFEIIAATDLDQDAPRVYGWTTNGELYRRAVAVEGTATRVVLDMAPSRDGWREVKGLTCL